MPEWAEQVMHVASPEKREAPSFGGKLAIDESIERSSIANKLSMEEESKEVEEHARRMRAYQGYLRM